MLTSLSTAHGPRALPLAVALLATTACGDELRNTIGERLQQRLVDSERPTVAGAELPPELVSNKLSLYVDCANSTRVPLYAGFREVNAVQASDKKARVEAITPVLEEWLEPCVKAQREGPLLQPPLVELEAAAADYLAKARELAAAIGAVRTGLSEKPAGDNAGSTDPSIRFAAAFARWDESRQAFDREIDRQQASVDAQVLAEIARRSGKRLEWHARDMMRAARPYVRCLGDHDEITAKICGGLYVPFEEAYKAFMTVHDADPTSADKVFWMSQFIASLGEYRSAAEALRGGLQDNKARSSDIGGAVREYNDLVRDFAALNFAAAAGAAP